MYEEDSGEDNRESVWHSSNKEYTSRTQAGNKKEERAYKTIGGHKDLGWYKRAKIRVNRMKLQERKRKELKLITGMKIGKWREVAFV